MQIKRLRNIDIEVILITSSKTMLNKIDITKYNKQYKNLKVFYNDNFHDIYFILDKIYIIVELRLII